MVERKYVKLKVNMYEDTKFKIIDMKPERDLIHYIWTRFITLAGKVNLEGKLYMSKNIPYTIETLAIEFNRGDYQVKLALDVFVELEMIELTEDNVYIVKNFVKHQNIKVKETIKPKDNECDNLEIENKDIKEISNKDSNDTSNDICEEKIDNNLQDNIPIVLEEKKNKKANKKKKDTIYFDEMEEENEDDKIAQFYCGDEGRPLKEGEYVVKGWSF